MGGLPTSTVNGFAVNPARPQVMYAGLREGIFRSENAGKTWTRVASGPTKVAAVAVNPTEASETWAVTVDGEVFRSTDAGVRWERRG